MSQLSSFNLSEFCPLIREMLNHSRNNDTRVNLPVVAVHGLVSAVGILENALILWVVGFRIRRTVIAVWVLNLALSDFLATLTLPLFTHYLASAHSWDLGQRLCQIQSTIFFVNMFVSGFLLASISLDRCLLVLRPVWCQNHRSVSAAWKVCAAVWAAAVLNSVPYSVFRAVIPRQDGRRLCYHNFALHAAPGPLERTCRLRQDATALSKFLLAFLIPFCVIGGSYALVSVRLRQRERRKGPARLSARFFKLVVAVIVVFLCCWAPYHAMCLLEVMAHRYPALRPKVEIGLPVATTFSFLNCVLNPVLYVFSCPDFCHRIRQSLAAVLEGLLVEDEEGGPWGGSGGGARSSQGQRRNTPHAPLRPPGSLVLSTQVSVCAYSFTHCSGSSSQASCPTSPL
uniref:Prostaglandin D2 receptor 2 n=1 Tax=Lepisosteus oculatus TaxID=7918 RepID=W5NNH9_LEPOC|nr:PREDICTED: prostaglandin D2 receptor 2 [Lepisosteus oculatus]